MTDENFVAQKTLHDCQTMVQSDRVYQKIVHPEQEPALIFLQLVRVLLECTECMKCRLLLPMIPVSVCLSVSHAA